MSSHKDNTHNKKLKDLLNKNKISDSEPLDDFEAEALEGFAMLENEEEILELQDQLDKRVYTEVFTEEKKSQRNYWYAAAGLVLIIGFSIYFIQNGSIAGSKDLAIQSEKKIPGGEIQKSIEEKTKKNEELQFKEPENVKKSQEIKAIQPQRENEAFKARDEEISNAGASEDASTLKETNGVQLESKAQAVPAMVSGEDKKLSAPRKTMEEPQKDKDLDKEDLAKTPAAEAKSDMTVAMNEVEVVKKAPLNKSAKYEAQPSAAGASGAHTTNSCYYSGGNDALMNDLKISLAAKNLLQKLDATLFIDEKNKVEKVIFTNSYDLSKSEQKQVTEILKQLNKFILTNTATGKSMAEFKLEFRP